MFLMQIWNCLPMCVAVSVVFLIGCGGSEDAKPAGELIPTSEASDSSTDETPAAVSADVGNTELKREELKFDSHQDQAIFLDEPPLPPPPTIVAKKINAPVAKYEDGTVKIERQVTKYSDDRFVNDGLYREYFPSGQMFIEGNYEIGEKEGTWKYWHQNGQLRRSITYANGKPSGNWEVVRADGTLESQRSFQAGKRHGEWLEYDDSGKVLRRRMPYQNGKPHGTWERWDEDGQKKSKYNFVDGLRDGLGFEWDNEGNKRAEISFKAGKIHGKATRWTSDGKVLTQQYENGQLQSEKIE